MKDLYLTQTNELKKQFNVKLYESSIEWIEATAKAYNTTATNIIRHALNMMKDMEAMKVEIDSIEEYYAKADIDIDTRYDMDEYDADTCKELHDENDRAEKEAGYALREKYAKVINHIASIPDAPSECPF